MAYQSIYLDPFDRDADFTVCIPFTCSGQDQVRGQTFDKTLVSTRTLRSLYENRHIHVATAIIPGTVTILPEPPLTGNAEVRHIGRGRFAVVRGDVRLTEMMSKEEAQAALDALPA